MKTLRDSGLAPKIIKHGVKLLGKGDKFATPVKIEVSRASKGAIEVWPRPGSVSITRVGDRGLR
jgi:ribosomal protein L15